MCSRYQLKVKESYELEDFLNSIDKGIISKTVSNNEGDLIANYNVAPTHVMPVSYFSKEGERVLESMSWGLIRWPQKPDKKYYSPVNARDDKLLESRMWNEPFKSTRCIIPLSGFYEWTGPKGNKTPHYIYPKDQPFFAAAGLYSNIGPDGSDLKSYTIITTEPNNMMENIHNRMPAFLHPEEFDDWLNPEHTTDYLSDMIKPFPNDTMDTYIVSKEVGNVKNNHPGLIEKAGLF